MYASLFAHDLRRLPPTIIWEDNVACKNWCENPVNHAKQKHIDVAFHFVREQQTEFNTLVIQTISGSDNPADLGTKPLPFPALERYIRQMMYIPVGRSLRRPCPTTAPALPMSKTAPNNSSQQHAAAISTEKCKPTRGCGIPAVDSSSTC